MDEDRWDPLNEVLPSSEADELGTNDVTVAPAQNPQAVHQPGESAALPSQEGEPQTPRPDQRNMTGGAVLPNNAQELAEDKVDESGIESFPASDPPAW